MRASYYNFLAVVGLCISGCSISDQSASNSQTLNPDDTQAESNPGVADVADPSQWERSTAVDPMTDREVISARRTIEQGGVKIQVEVKCSNPTLTYLFTAFDEKGEGLRYRIQMGSADQNYAPAIPLTVRTDRARAVDITVAGNDYANELKLEENLSPQTLGEALRVAQNDTFGGLNLVQLAKAQTAFLKLRFQDRDLLLELDQSDSTLREVLDSCIPTKPNALMETVTGDGPSPSTGDVTDESGVTENDTVNTNR